MEVLYDQLGKCGDRVWQRARYGLICYPAFIPVNPRTPAQCGVRGNFGGVSARWRTIPQDYRDIWGAVAKTKKSRPHLGCGPITGFNLFVKVNVALVNRGLAQVDLPLEFLRALESTAASRLDAGSFAQPPIGPVLFLRARQLLDDWQDHPQEFMAGVSPPAG